MATRTAARTGGGSTTMELMTWAWCLGCAAIVVGTWNGALHVTHHVAWGDWRSCYRAFDGKIGATTWLLFAFPAAVLLSLLTWLLGKVPTGRRAGSDLARQRSSAKRWATAADIAPLVKREAIERVGVDRVPIGWVGNQMVTTEAGRSLLVMAPTGAGKTPRDVVPIVLRHRGPALITSVKTDVYELTCTQRAKLGRVMRFDPAHPERSLRWSPLEIVRDWSSALRAASYFTSTAASSGKNWEFWRDNAEDFLAPLLLHAAVNDLTMADVASAIYTIDESAPSIIRSLATAGHRDAADRLSALMDTVKETRDGVLTTARTIFKAWNHPDIQACVNVRAGEEGADVLHIADLLHSTDTLYMVASSSEQSVFAPVFETLINAVYREIERAYAESGGHPLTPRLLMMLDEAANIARIRRLPEMASAGAGQGLLLVSVWQDEGQIILTLGPEAARTVMSNHWAKLYLGGISDQETLRNVSAWIGKEVMTLTSTSTRPDGRPSVSTSEHELDVAPPGELASMRDGASIVMCSGYKPMRLTQRGWFEDKQLRAMIDPATAARFDADFTVK